MPGSRPGGAGPAVRDLLLFPAGGAGSRTPAGGRWHLVALSNVRHAQPADDRGVARGSLCSADVTADGGERGDHGDRHGDGREHQTAGQPFHFGIPVTEGDPCRLAPYRSPPDLPPPVTCPPQRELRLPDWALARKP